MIYHLPHHSADTGSDSLTPTRLTYSVLELTCADQSKWGDRDRGTRLNPKRILQKRSRAQPEGSPFSPPQQRALPSFFFRKIDCLQCVRRRLGVIYGPGQTREPIKKLIYSWTKINAQTSIQQLYRTMQIRAEVPLF